MPVRFNKPEPDLVKPVPEPLISPLNVRDVPETLMIESASSLTVPETEEPPVLTFKVPPLRVMASKPISTFCKSRVALVSI